MVDAIGANRLNKLKELELQKQMQAQQAQKAQQNKESEAAVPKDVQEVSQAMAATQNDAVQYQAQPGGAQALTAPGNTAQPNQMQTNVAAVQEADEIIKSDELKTQDKTAKEAPKEESLVAPETPPEVGAVKTEKEVGEVKQDSVFNQTAEPPKAPEKPVKPVGGQTKEEERIKDPGKAEANITADAEELLKRKERKGIQPQQ